MRGEIAVKKLEWLIWANMSARERECIFWHKKYSLKAREYQK